MSTTPPLRPYREARELGVARRRFGQESFSPSPQRRRSTSRPARRKENATRRHSATPSPATHRRGKCTRLPRGLTSFMTSLFSRFSKHHDRIRPTSPGAFNPRRTSLGRESKIHRQQNGLAPHPSDLVDREHLRQHRPGWNDRVSGTKVPTTHSSQLVQSTRRNTGEPATRRPIQSDHQSFPASLALVLLRKLRRSSSSLTSESPVTSLPPTTHPIDRRFQIQPLRAINVTLLSSYSISAI